MTTINISIDDDNGAPHEYVITRHAGRDGIALFRRLSSALSASLVMADGEVGIDLQAALTAIADTADHATILDILKHTRRDGKVLTAAVVDEVFAGNYGELGFAIVEALKANFESAFNRLSAGKLDSLIGS